MGLVPNAEQAHFAAWQAAARLRRWWRGSAGAQILSDVDDTIKCSGGPIGGGVDESGYRKEIYPGAVQFILELARGRELHWAPRRVRLLSARPQKLGFLRMKPGSRVAEEFRRVGEANGFPEWGIDFEGSAYGRLRDLVPALRGDFRRFGRTKVRNWREVLGDDLGQAKAVFIGDNGQGDVQAALQMARFGPPFAAAFIHRVLEEPEAPKPAAPSHRRVFYFSTYPGAAQAALGRNLISEEGLRRVHGAVLGSSLAQLCALHAQDPGRFQRYPCRREGDLFWADGSPVVEVALDPEDPTVRLRRCKLPLAHPEIDRGGRCAPLLAELKEAEVVLAAKAAERRSGLRSKVAAWFAQRRKIVTSQAPRSCSVEDVSGDFSPVQEKIDVMIKALKTEQADEVKKKDYCIEELSKNKPLRLAPILLAAEDKQRQGESLDASVQDLKQKLQALVAESEELSAEVAELQKQQTLGGIPILQLSAQNREKENAEFQKVVQDQRETQVLLKKAMVVLQGFYNKESLLQAVPPVEPETFGSYKKKSGGNGAARPVVMMLQQLVADAQEMETEASAAERSSQLDYEAFGQETTASLAAKNKALEDKAGSLKISRSSVQGDSRLEDPGRQAANVQAGEKAKLEEKAVMARQSKKGVLAEAGRACGLEQRV
ncbi:unnamed protein product [Effrenium voratum]|uniref:Uncharacterized protein n=1 Tax=Effrenium voratum TaxID=2562239 RepID=A0AA36N4I9_9DINO|nr:unnamed protein product [Effrenium voratum]